MSEQKKAEAKTETKAPELKIGDTVMMTGVYGIMVNPDDPKNVLGDGNIRKVTIDAWYLDQFKAGKLALAD